jgi:PAS domain S-box-containing protein
MSRKPSAVRRPSHPVALPELHPAGRAAVRHPTRPRLKELRRQAESRLRPRQHKPKATPFVLQSVADPQRQFHELQVHQVELELQNAELQETRDRMEGLLEKYTDLYDFAPAGYFSLDQSGTILEANLTGAALLGVERSRLLNRRLPLWITPASRPDFLAFLQRLFAGAAKPVCEALLLREDATSFWGEFHGSVALSLGRAGKWCRVTLSDISALKQADEVRGRMAAIVQSSDDAIIGMDLDGRITSWNPGAEKIFGFTAGEVEGTSVLRLVPTDRNAEEQLILGRIKAGKSVQHFETIRQKKNGRLIHVSITASPIKNAVGRVIGVSKVARDITERKRAEAVQRRIEVLAASNRKLEQEIARRRAVEASLHESESHQTRLLEQSRHMQEELRHLSRQVLRAQEEERKRISRELHDVIAQTLTGINIRLATLKKEAAMNTRGFARSITRTQRLVEQAVNTVHQFARELRPAVLDDLGLIPALHTFMKHFAARTGVRAHLTAFAGLEPLDLARRTVLFRVAQEALTNVARHAHASRVEVSLQKVPGGICMKVQDDGKSFQAQHILHSKRNQRLGLIGMRERLEMVGGSFDVRSAPGQGTTVEARLPLGQARAGGR